MERMFSGWANIVATRSCIVFWVAMVVFIGFSKFQRSPHIAK